MIIDTRVDRYELLEIYVRCRHLNSKMNLVSPASVENDRTCALDRDGEYRYNPNSL